jgi:hypothetical protein
MDDAEVQPSSHLKLPQPAALAHYAGPRDCEQARHGLVRQPPFLIGEVLDEFWPVVVVLVHAVIVDCLLDELSAEDERVDGVGRGVSGAKERLAVDLADGSPVDFDGWVGPDYLQVEYEPAGLDRVDHFAQDVHDVLRIDSSE